MRGKKEIFGFTLSCTAAAFIAATIALAPAHAQTIRQDKLYIDDGTGKFTILMSGPLTGGNQTLTFPAINSNATILVSSASSVQTLSGGITVNNGATLNGGTTINGGATINGGLTLNGSFSLGTPLGVSSGGTGLGSYTAGDLLYASSSSALSTLHIGSTNQVLGISGGVPAWTANGATITNTINSPTPLTSSPVNDYTVDASSTYIRLKNTSGNMILTGLSNSGVANGRVVTLVNIGSNSITLKSQTGSANGNQFSLPANDDIILGPGGAATFIYDNNNAPGFWELTNTN